MSDFAVQVIETVLVLLLYVVFYFVSNRTINVTTQVTA